MGTIGADYRKPGLSPQGDFRHHQRKTKSNYEQDMDQKKDPAAIFCRKIGKPPDIAQPDGRTCRGQNKANAARKWTAFFHKAQHSEYIFAQTIPLPCQHSHEKWQKDKWEILSQYLLDLLIISCLSALFKWTWGKGSINRRKRENISIAQKSRHAQCSSQNKKGMDR